MKLNNLPLVLSALFVLAFAPACDGDDDDTDSSEGGGEDTITNPTDPTDPTVGDECPANPPVEMVASQEITVNTTWGCDKLWLLTGPVYINNNAILTVNAGTTVLGQSGSYLLAARGAQLHSLGTADAPVVFSSSQPVGSRAPGDWGGLILNGLATNNLPAGEGNSEGVPPGALSAYGGTDDASSCGILQYTRVSFAGFELTADNELNTITFNSCGLGTVVDHIQVHMGDDDGIEMFGGTWNGKYIVATGILDDGVDTDEGYRGKLQYLYTHQGPTGGNYAYEQANYNNDHGATPQHHVRIVNATLIGVGAANGTSSAGPHFKEGASGWVHNTIVMNHENAALEVINQATADRVTAGLTQVSNTFFFNNALSGAAMWRVSDDVPFDLEAYVTDPANANVFDTDPMLTSTTWGSPNIAPLAGSPVLTAGSSVADEFFDATTFVGAVESAATDWTVGWTDYTPS